MPHIHTGEGEIDFAVSVYVVYKNRVLLRMHEKHHRWFSVGGHIELNETPQETAVREVKEEVGLDVVLWEGNKESVGDDLPEYQYRELIPSLFLNIHKISDTHRHISFAYFAKSESDAIIEPETHEKSGGCMWLTREELTAHPDVDSATKHYALRALDILGESTKENLPE